MDPKKTGIMILEARKKLNMTQKDLAEKLFISDKAVSKWERGLCFPDISVLIPLTEVLNISLYDLLRGEKMKKEEVEETIKNTINYSNKELKKKKKKYIMVSSIIISIIIIISFILIFMVKSNQLRGIVDKDKIYNINYYMDYQTTINNENTEKLELILMKLPLEWKERTFEISDHTLEIDYNVSYYDVVKAYNDKDYVNQAMINNALVIFTTVSDVNEFKIRFNDNSYTISKNKLAKEFSISSFHELLNEKMWTKKVSEKLMNGDIVNKTFKLFNVKKVSKKELNKSIVSDE